jgi:hypothetical protein
MCCNQSYCEMSDKLQILPKAVRLSASGRGRLGSDGSASEIDTGTGLDKAARPRKESRLRRQGSAYVGVDVRQITTTFGMDHFEHYRFVDAQSVTRLAFSHHRNR